MFEKLRYQRAVKHYFRPNESIAVDRKELIQILRGEVANPGRLENAKTSCDFDYYLISIPQGSPINSWAGQSWIANCFEIAEEQSNWYGRFFCERESHIVIPSRKESIIFNPRSTSPLGKIAFSNYVHPLYLTGGSFQSDKVGQRTLVTDIDITQLKDCLRQVYEK